MGRPTITLRQATEKAHAIAHFGRPRRRAAVGRAGLCGIHRPTAHVQEKLIKTSLLTFNDANLTGNYAVMHAKLAEPFRDKFSPDQLKKAFKSFIDQKIDLAPIVLKPPVATTETKIDGRGALQVRGYFDTAPSRVLYEIDFVPSEGEWKPIALDVKVRAAGEK
jgi:hypothetical protein